MTPMKSGGTLACALVALPAVIFVAQDGMAADFAIKEQSGAALGNAFSALPPASTTSPTVSTTRQ